MNGIFKGIIQHKKEHRKYKRIRTLLALLSLPISGFTTDIYISSLPDMTHAFHVTNIQIQATLTLFLVSYGIGQLFIGGILDCFGRYWIYLLSMLVFSAASLAIALLSNIYLVYCMRIVQGLTVSAIVVAKRAYFVDEYTGKKLTYYLSMFSIIWSTGPIVAPFIGGYLQSLFGWQANFYFLSVAALLLALGDLVFGGETLRKPAPFNVQYMMKIYGEMLKTRSFIFSILIVGLSYAVMMVYNMTASFIIEHHFGYSEITTGFCSLLLGLAWLLGGLIGRMTMMAPFSRKLIWSTGVQLLLTILMLAVARVTDGLYSLVFFAGLIQICAGYTFNNLLTYCMGMFPQAAGIAIGLTGGINLIAVSVFSYAVVGVMPAKNEAHLASSYLLLTLASAVAMLLILLPERKPVQRTQ